MRYFRFVVPGDEVHLYPLPCWHIGARQSSEGFIRHVLKLIREDPLARWIYLGDGGECALKNSKGNIYEQLMNPGEQLRTVAALLAHVKDKGLFGIRGNHGNRIDRETGLGWDEMLCSRIVVPYLGVSSFGTIELRPDAGPGVPVSVYVHHGSSSSVSVGGKFNAAKKPEAYSMADVTLTAHTHMLAEVPERLVAWVNHESFRVEWKRLYGFVCGSAYDSRSGYAEEKQYPPIVPGHMVVKLKVLQEGHSRRIVVSGEKIRGIGEEFTDDRELMKWTLSAAQGVKGTIDDEPRPWVDTNLDDFVLVDPEPEVQS